MAKRNDNGGDSIMVALDSFVVGEHHTVIAGNTYRSSDRAVLEHPDRFAPWLDTTTGEREALRRELAQRERERDGFP